MSENGIGIQKSVHKTNRKTKQQEEANGRTVAKKRKTLTQEESIKLDKFLGGLFSQRPIWAKYALQAKLANAGLGEINHFILAKLRLISEFQKYTFLVQEHIAFVAAIFRLWHCQTMFLLVLPIPFFQS